MIRILALLSAGLLTLVFFALSVTLLTACGAKLPFGLGEIGICTGNRVIAERQLTIAFERQAVLRRRVTDLEAALGTQDCVGASDAPTASAQKIDADAWEGRDVSLLDGCWMLDSDYRLSDVDTGVVYFVDTWEMCFDSTGNGSQTLRFDDGSLCRSSKITAAFDDNGNLIMSDNANVSCDGGSYIYERNMTCALDADGSASCVSSQPETGASSRVRLHR